LGGPHTPAVGWAAGIERLAMLLEAPQPDHPLAVLVPMGDAATLMAIGLLADLRSAGIAADMGYKGNMKKRMQRANDAGARFAIIMGDDELARGEVSLKDLGSGEQKAVAVAGLAEALRGA
jgi:histidyl-tRNA synthetase